MPHANFMLHILFAPTGLSFLHQLFIMRHESQLTAGATAYGLHQLLACILVTVVTGQGLLMPLLC